MPDAGDITDSIAQNAADGIKTVTVAGQTTEVLPIADQIKARDDALAQQAVASDRPGLGIRFQRFNPVYR